jgi:hypothetical protein
MLTLVPALSILDQNESDATIFINGEPQQGKITSDGGEIYVYLDNTEDTSISVKIVITNNNTKNEVGNTIQDIPAKSEHYKVTVNVNFGGTGEYNAKITCTDTTTGEITYTTMTVTVTDTVWSSWTAYAAIAIVVILIVIAVFVHMRNAPKIKPDTTFTELEAEKNEGKPVKTEERVSSTEKKRYKTNSLEKEQTAKKTEPAKEESRPKKKEEPKKVEPVKEEPKPKKKEEPKAQSFTEIEEKKKTSTKEKKDSAPSDSEEPKKLKYVSSRRK